jgi:hypothetical protein
MSESFHVNLSYYGSVVLKEIFFPIFAFSWLFPLWRGPGPLFEQFKIHFIQGWYVPSLIEIGLLVLEKICFHYKHKWIWFSILWPPDPRGLWFEETWIYIISESFHADMTYSGSVVLEKKIFKWPTPFLWLSSLWREPGPLFEQFRIPFTQ